MPKAYWIARVDVRDPGRYKDYVSTAKPAFERFGANFIARGGKADAVEGPGRARNVASSNLKRCNTRLIAIIHLEYQAAAAIRQTVADGEDRDRRRHLNGENICKPQRLFPYRRTGGSCRPARVRSSSRTFPA